MAEIERANVVELAKLRLADIPAVNLERADAIVERASGRVIIVPPQESPVSGIAELAKGAIVAGVDVEHAPPDAFLQHGSYSIKVLKDHGTWVAQFIKEDKIVASTTQVRVVETSEKIAKPVAVVFSFSPCVGCIFLLGVVVGLYIASR